MHHDYSNFIQSNYYEVFEALRRQLTTLPLGKFAGAP